MCHAENGNEHAGAINYLNILSRWTDVTFSGSLVS
jgi:hypothetical protein